MVAAIDLNLYPSSFHVTDLDDTYHTPADATPNFTTKTAEVQSSTLYDDDDDDDDDDDEEDEDDEYVSFEKEAADDGNIEMNLSLSNENKKLKKQLSIVLDKCNSLETQVSKLMQDKQSLIGSNPKKRKFNDDDDDESPTVQQSSWKRQQAELPAAAAATISSGIRRVYVHTDPSDKTLVVKDEYQWRKYGQKVTRDNPSPRAYYKCSYAPSCPVKKKVQRSLDNDSIVVATYEGEHNHRSAKEEAAYALAHECTQDQRRTFDQSPKFKFDEVLVEQMAKYLSNNATFTSDLAAAIYSKLLDVDLLNLC